VVPLWSFVAVTLPLVLSPGVSTAVVLRNSVAGGVRAGLATAVGANAGSVCYGLLSAAGVTLALQRWPSAWTALRWAGVLYISWLGVKSLRRAVQPTTLLAGGGVGTAGRGALAHINEGFLTNVLNPAIATFYFVVLPQFVPRAAPVVRSVLLLTTVHVGLALSWHSVWAAAGGRLATVLSRRRPRQVLDAVAGLTLLALAIKMGAAFGR
jgi:threonine/homoserine/homoserine lactone efflux protein